MCNLKKLFKKFAFVLCVLFVYWKIINKPARSPSETKDIDRFLPDLKYILLWTRIHGINLEGQKHFINKRCKKINCFFTYSKKMLGPIQYFDAVVFNLQDVSKGVQKLPNVRGHFQKYIFAANDSSDNYPVCDPVYDGFFNWTWTYRSDSTIPYRFITAFNENNEEIGNHFSKKLLYKTEPVKHVVNKSIAATTFLDKCKSRSQREKFIVELSNKIAVYNMTLDVYGKCGQKECRKKTMKSCFRMLKNMYFFYLALEDSLDDDYVTQEVLYAYDNNAIPIVYGQADYERYLPPNSYLDAIELGTDKLAKIMHQVVTNYTRYKEFFKWKNEYTVVKSDVLDVCNLCTALNNPHWLTYDVTYHDFRDWWNPNYTSRCSE